MCKEIEEWKAEARTVGPFTSPASCRELEFVASCSRILGMGGYAMTLRQLLTDNQPFGPEDQALIDNLTDAVDLTGLYGPVSAALSGKYILVSGRKGCGKSAVISMLRGIERAKGRLQKERIMIDEVHHRTRFINVKTWTEFLSMNTNVIRYLSDSATRRNYDKSFYELIPAEVVEAAWISELWEKVFQIFYNDLQGSGDLISYKNVKKFKNLLLCFDDDGMAALRGTPEYIASSVFEGARREVEEFIVEQDMYICLLFDSIEKYPLTNETFFLSMGGFLRAINTLTHRNHRFRIVFALPEEIIHFIRATSTNILKDFARSFSMKWKPADLWRIAAYRYRLFLNLHDNVLYQEMNLSITDWTDRKQLQEFFDAILPTTVKNSVGIDEPSAAYIVRHTFLVPRHFLVILNRAAIESYKEEGHWRTISADSIVKGIKSAEQDIADEIFVPFEGIYRGLKSSLNRVLGGLPPIFRFGDLDKAISRISKQFNLEDHEMIKLLFDMGIIGRIRDKPSGDENSKIYTYADFFFNLQGNVSFSGSDILCFHPVFSTYFNADTRRNGDTRVIYPNGISTGL